MRTTWDAARRSRDARLARARAVTSERWVPRSAPRRCSRRSSSPGDRVCLEGDNQKQADFLAREPRRRSTRRASAACTSSSPCSRCPSTWSCSSAASPAGWTSPSPGRRRVRLAQLVAAGKIEIGAIHTYLELYARYFVDLTPRVALVAAAAADREGNLYTGPNTEDTPAIVEATAFKDGIVVAQVDERRGPRCRASTSRRLGRLRDRQLRPRLHRAALHPRPRPDRRDPGPDGDDGRSRGSTPQYGVQRLNHGIGFDTAAIELHAADVRRKLGLQGQDLPPLGAQSASRPSSRRSRAGLVELNPLFGSELGMEDYIRRAPRRLLHRARRELRSNRAFCPDGRALRLRPLHRLDAADRSRGQQLDRDREPHHRLRRRAEHGRGRARAPSRQPGLARGGARGQRRRAARCRAAASSWCRSSRPSGSTWSRPSWSGSTRGGSPRTCAWRCRR